MQFRIVGWPGDEASLRLDYRAFAYAGKFVVGGPGKAVLRTEDGSPAVPGWEPDEALPDGIDPGVFDDDVLAAVSFSPDRTDPSRCRLRYVTVHIARRGEGFGPRLIARVVSRLAGRGYDSVAIAVNNPFAYEALYKVGFAYAGERTGIAELVLERPTARPADRASIDGSGRGRPASEREADEPDAVERYRAGLARFRDRDLGRAERRFLAARADADPPDVVGPG